MRSAIGTWNSGWITGTSWTPPSSLPAAEYNIVVYARDPGGLQSGASPDRYFTLDPTPPPAPSPVPAGQVVFRRDLATFVDTNHCGVVAGNWQLSKFRMGATFTLQQGDGAEMRLLTVVNRGSPNWFVVRVIDGTVRLQHWGAVGPVEPSSGVNIADGRPHRVELTYQSGVFAIAVDGSVALTAQNSLTLSGPAPFVFAGGECVYGFRGTVQDMTLEDMSASPTPAPPTQTPTSTPTATSTSTPTPPATSTAQPVQASTITFDDRAGQNQVLTGQYPVGVIDWGGTGSWSHSGPWGSFTTKSLSFNGSAIRSASFSFVTPRRLISVRAYNGGTVASTVSLNSPGLPTKTVTVPAGQVVTIATGWTTNCSGPVTYTSSTGDQVNLDDFVIN